MVMIYLDTSIFLQAREAGIRLDFEQSVLPDNPLLYLEADSNKIAQVIRNLVSNALKFTRSDGTVKVCASVQRTSKRLAVDDSSSMMSKVLRSASVYPTKSSYDKNTEVVRLVLTVTDSGAGISKVPYLLMLQASLSYEYLLFAGESREALPGNHPVQPGKTSGWTGHGIGPLQ
jgi:hypothetical protein